MPPPDSRSLESRVGDARQRGRRAYQADINAERNEINDPLGALTAETEDIKDKKREIFVSEQPQKKGAKEVSSGLRKRAVEKKATPQTTTPAEIRVLPDRFNRAAQISFDQNATKEQLDHYLNVLIKLAHKTGDLRGFSRETERNLRELSRRAIDSIGRKSHADANDKYYTELRKLLTITGIDLNEYERLVTKNSSANKLSEAA